MSGACSKKWGGVARSQSAGLSNGTKRPSRTGNGIAGRIEKNAQRLGAPRVFLDASGFLLLPNVARTWAPQGKAPLVRYCYKQDRISAIGALAVSPKRRRRALDLQLRTRNLTGLDVHAFLHPPLRHLRGSVVLLWDRGPIHRRSEVKQWIHNHPRLQAEEFPADAPELNPAEYVWNQSDRALANSAPTDLVQLYRRLRHAVRRLRGSQKLLWSCIYASDLPWTR